MQPLDEYPIGSDRDVITPSPERDGAWRVWVFVALAAMVAAGVVAFFYLRTPSEPADSAVPAAGAAATQPSVPAARDPLGPAIEPRDLPPLDLTDPVVRELLSGLSSRPELAAWLATDGLVRNIAVAVDNVARGSTPSAHLRRLAPQRPFVAQARGESFVIDPQSYRRYDGVADTVAALDANGLARAYVTLRPRLQEAYDELGNEGTFDDAVQRAIARLLSTPVLEREVGIRPSPVLYQFADERLERLTGAQKQLLRMGPRNVGLIQDKLRELAGALRIPIARLAQP